MFVLSHHPSIDFLTVFGGGTGIKFLMIYYFVAPTVPGTEDKASQKQKDTGDRAKNKQYGFPRSRGEL